MLHKRSRILWVFTTMFLVLCLLIKCTGGHNKTSEQTGISTFAGAEKCQGCHKEIYKDHLQTGHYLSSTLPEAAFFAGNFKPGMNAVAYDPITTLRVEKTDSGYFQTAYLYNQPKKAERIDFIIGSGKKGQSYLGWADANLVQLPATWFTPAHQWTNSPGYPADKIIFNRPITARCLECHSTKFDEVKSTRPNMDAFCHEGIILGISCEKCHGPAAKHTAFHEENPSEKKAKFIINPKNLSRQQSLDLCALCHGGRLNKTKPSFGFQPGDVLFDYFREANPGTPAENIDVHGNQLGLLKASKCFSMSTMTCLSCHDAHQKENDDVKLYSAKCLACHGDTHQKQCKLLASEGEMIRQNCIDCHMPKQASKSIAVTIHHADTLTPVMMRTHYIKMYAYATKNVLDTLKHNTSKKK